MFSFLDQYESKGRFVFRQNDNLGVVCNAPKNCSGVYLVYTVKDNNKRLVYIGCSGLEEDGKIKMRQDGLWGRLVKGKQFGIQRTQSWPSKIIELKLDSLYIEWWNTKNDFPEIVEYCALAEYMHEYNYFPDWNNEFRLKEALHKKCLDYIKKNIEYFAFIGTEDED